MLLIVSPIIYASCFHIKNGKTNVLPFFFQGPLKHVRRVSQLHPFSYGEGIELDPLPPKVLRWCSFDFSWLKLCTLFAFRLCDQLNMHWTATSYHFRYTASVRYDSDRHYIQDVCLQPTGFGLELCSQTIMAISESTWRRYKTQLEFEPRQRVQRYRSTTIVYPKHARTLYTTQLSYDEHKLAKRFLSSVELEVSECKTNQCWRKSLFGRNVNKLYPSLFPKNHVHHWGYLELDGWNCQTVC